jgi:two-component system OmpR family sensor kinase
MQRADRWPFRDRLLDVAWALFALANLVAMLVFPRWETVPFHFIWLSLTIVYGFRVWRTGRTAWTLAGVIVLTGIVLASEVADHAQPADELTEVPLMACMFVAMVWHARRRLSATADVQRISDDNRRLLDREKRFIQDASHQLRTPITIALGHAELIARRDDPDDPAGEDARVIVDELERLRRLAELLLQIVGAEDGPPHESSDVHIDVMVAETVRRWMVTPRRWGIGRLDSATVIGDADQLQMALDELVQNAVTHTEPDDRITLEVRASAGSALVVVSDTGTGIPPADRNRIFERFARADADAERRTGGIGLGLSFVKSVVESHGGRVGVTSSIGAGSAFELSIPMAPAAQPPAAGERMRLRDAEPAASEEPAPTGSVAAVARSGSEV